MHKTEVSLELSKPIALIGMPGSGKSTIGKALSKKLNYEFVDSDKAIEKIEQTTIPQIFEQQGETVFRRMEKDIILQCLKNEKSDFILSTGGGAIMTPEIKKALLKESNVVFLNVSLKELWSRIKSSKDNRPLLNQDDDQKLKLENLYYKREATYLSAHITIDCDKMNISEIVSKIENELEAHGK